MTLNCGKRGTNQFVCIPNLLSLRPCHAVPTRRLRNFPQETTLVSHAIASLNTSTHVTEAEMRLRDKEDLHAFCCDDGSDSRCSRGRNTCARAIARHLSAVFSGDGADPRQRACPQVLRST